MTKTMRQRLRLGTHASVAATGLATVLALSMYGSAPAYADGDANAKARGPGVRSLSAIRRDVLIDYSALDALQPRGRGPQLLIAQNSASPLTFNDSAPIVLQPPPGVAPVLIPPPGVKGAKTLNTTAAIKLRPPAGVKLTAPKAAAPVRTAKVDVTPVPAPKVEAPKPAPKVEIAKAEPPKAAVVPTPAPKAAVPVAPTPAPIAPPKAAAPIAPPPAPKVEPPKAAAPTQPPVAPPVAKAEVQPPAPKVEAPKPAIITPPPPAPAPAPAKAAAPPAPAVAPAPVAPPKAPVVTAAPAPIAPPAAGAPRSLLPEAKPETKVAVIPPVAEAPKAPEAPVEVKPEEPKAEAQTAALPPPAKATIPDTLTIGFDVGVPDVPGAATADLKGLAARMKADAALRVQLLAFASDPEKSVSRSRRLSLERAVNVRKQLLAAGIDSTRIEVRALGEQSGDGAPDRVDAITSRR